MIESVPVAQLDFTRTVAAIDAYDALDAAFMAADTEAKLWKALAELNAAGEAVGYAYGLDTSDRNSLETCRSCVRPGPKVPPPGAELSFVRRMVADWRARNVR